MGGLVVDDRVDGDMQVWVDVADAGVIEDGEVFHGHVEPLLRVPVGEGERSVLAWMIFKEVDPFLAPVFVSGIELVLRSDGVEAISELVQRLVG